MARRRRSEESRQALPTGAKLSLSQKEKIRTGRIVGIEQSECRQGRIELAPVRAARGRAKITGAT
jgi:hypothetical protein